MSYIINKTDGTVLVTLLDGTTNADTGLTLIGRNYTTYGEIQNENFIRLLENFSATTPPGLSVGFTPVQGQLWWDKSNQLLKVYDTNGSWIPVSQRTSSNVAPTINAVGDQWWDTITNQLSVWTGATWLQIGPVYSAAQGKTGTFAETVTDTTANTHVVSATYVAGNIASITSYDAAFIPSSPLSSTFSTIQPGLNILAAAQFNGTTTNSVRVGGLYANVLAKINTVNTFAENIAFSKKIILTDANLYFSNQTLTLQNDSYNGDVVVYVNGTQGNIAALSLSGTTGLATVFGTPTDNNHIANRKYVDDVAIGLQDNIDELAASSGGEISQITAEFDAKLAVVVTTTNANLLAATNSINANVTALSLSTDNRFLGVNIAITGLQSHITVVDNTLILKANIASPVFTGAPLVSGALLTPGTDTTQIATTAFVNQQANVSAADYNSKINNLSVTTTNAIIAATAPKAPSDSPVFTGTVTAPTPAPADYSTKVATTAFVSNLITSNKFNYTVSTSAPSGGNDGDFWFRIG